MIPLVHGSPVRLSLRGANGSGGSVSTVAIGGFPGPNVRAPPDPKQASSPAEGLSLGKDVSWNSWNNWSGLKK